MFADGSCRGSDVAPARISLRKIPLLPLFHRNTVFTHLKTYIDWRPEVHRNLLFETSKPAQCVDLSDNKLGPRF
jgi:hypothetical protein